MATLDVRKDRKDRPYSVRWRESGRQRRRSFRRKSEARAWLAEALKIEDADRWGETYTPAGRKAKDSTQRGRKSRTLREQADLWMRTRTHLARTTRTGDASCLNNWILSIDPGDGGGILGDRQVAEIHPEHLEAALAAVTRAGKSGSLRQRVYTTWNLVMDHAVAHGVIAAHGGRNVVCGTPRRKRQPQPFTDDELDRLLNESDFDESDELYCRVLATLGLRPQEATALTVEQFNWTAGTNGAVLIDRAVKRDGHIAGTKNQKLRRLPLPPNLSDDLRNWIERHELQRDHLLFPGRGAGVPRNIWSWTRRRWKPAVRRVGLDDRTPYDLRHTCASRLIAQGASVPEVAEWMGHTKDVCLKVYAHLFPGRKAELAGLLYD